MDKKKVDVVTVRIPDPPDGVTPAALGALMAGDVENAMVAMTPGGIERQEKQGQEALVKAANRLPEMGLFKTWPCWDEASKSYKAPDLRPYLEQQGFVFGDLLSGKDAIFRQVTLPKGWYIEAAGHALHSTLKDNLGRARASIAFKAAFYDYTSSMFWERRFAVDAVYLDHDGQPFDWDSPKDYAPPACRVCLVDRARPKGWQSMVTIGVVQRYGDRCDTSELSEVATVELKQRFPRYEDPTAYWDDPWKCGCPAGTTIDQCPHQ